MQYCFPYTIFLYNAMSRMLSLITVHDEPLLIAGFFFLVSTLLLLFYDCFCYCYWYSVNDSLLLNVHLFQQFCNLTLKSIYSFTLFLFRKIMQTALVQSSVVIACTIISNIDTIPRPQSIFPPKLTECVNFHVIIQQTFV